MREFYIKKLLILIVLLCFFESAEAQGRSNGEQKEAIDSLSVAKDFARFSFSMGAEKHQLIFTQLKVGEEYEIYLNKADFSADCDLQVVVEEQAIFFENRVLKLNAKKPTLELTFKKETCKRSVPLDISVGCTSCGSGAMRSQPPAIETDNAYDPVALVRDVFIGGDCFDVDSSSINFVGNDLARGFFSSGSSSINIEEGVILSTGNIANSAGPNEDYNTGNSFASNVGDADLSAMINSNSIYDVASLEFDFTPTTSQISFEFVFASEEYCEYVNSNFNDVFGFFISGPGFNGPFSNNAENIAIVPNTTDYIAINSVNHLLNSNYYLNNIPSWQHDEMPANLQCESHPSNDGIAIEDIEFDGFTTVMTVTAEVQACETYHIKLAIADVYDAYFDSAVFLKANSFDAGATANVSAEVPGGTVPSNIAFEDCQDGFFVFERVNEDLSDSVVVHFSYSSMSTAIPGIDFEAFADSIVIPAGDSVYFLEVNIFSDVLNEGLETLILELDAPCTCDIPTIEMFINDYPELLVELDDSTFCGAAAMTLVPTLSGGIGDYTFVWNTNDSVEIIDINPDTTTSYLLTVTDECGNSAVAQSTIEIIEVPAATISGYQQVCPENPSAEIVIDLLGESPWEIIYSINGIPQAPISGVMSSPYILIADELGVYHLNSIVHNGCEGTVQGAASVVATSLQIDAEVNEESCPEASDGSIEITASGGANPYEFNWDNGIGATQNPNNLVAGTYNLTLTDANACSEIFSIIVPLSDAIPTVDAGEDETLNCTISTLNLNGSGSQGANFNYLWTTAGGNILSGATSLSPLIDQAGTYFLNVTNSENGCTMVDEAVVFIDTLAPIPNIEIIGPLVLDCSNSATVLDGSGSSPFGVLTFEWTTLDGNITPGDEDQPNPEVNAAGTYQLAVTNTDNGCSAAISFSVEADIDLPVVEISPPMILNCVDTVVQLDAGNSAVGAEFQYIWETDDGNILNGNNTLFPIVGQPGFYNLTILNTANDCENSAMIEVTEDVEVPIADAGISASLDCNTFETTLNGDQSSIGILYNYNWETNDGNILSGATSLNPAVGAAGVYFLTVLNHQNGCSATDEVLVTEDENTPSDAVVEALPPACFGDFGSISVLSVLGGDAPYLYSIDDGENFYSDAEFYNVSSGSYDLIIQDAKGCQFALNLIVPQVVEMVVSLEPEAEIELGDDYQINAHLNISLSQIDTIIWSPEVSLSCGNCLNPVAFPFENTLYTVTVFDENGCEATAEILLRVDLVRNIFIPNAFSPNADGVNDVFLIYSNQKSVAKINRFQIFNRWGGKVFEVFDVFPDDPDFGWNGMVKGKLMNPAVFVYVAEIEFLDGVKVMYSGDLTLLK